MTKVMFRKWKGEVIALFPEIRNSQTARYCQSYMHIGQHGEADDNLIVNQSSPPTIGEYEPLLKELVQIGYDDLKIIKRRNFKRK